MKLIQKLKIWKELKRLEGRVHQAPSPSTFVDLGQVYINLEMHDRTLQLADEGLALFPNSNELRKLRRFAKKHQLDGRVRELKSRLAKGAHPKLYGELAGMYLELGDYDAVHGACEECIRRFPDDDAAYLVLARAHLTHFYRDLIAQDGLEAVRNLETVISIDPNSIKAHKLLAEVFYRAGATESALEHLRVVRDTGTTDPEIEAMFKNVQEQPKVSVDDVASMFQRVEASGSLACPAVLQERSMVVPESDEKALLQNVRAALGTIIDIEGVTKGTYIKGGRALVKGDIRDGKDSFLRIARVVAKAAQRASRRMDIGNFNKGIVDVGTGFICMCNYGDVLAAVMCDSGAPVDEIVEELQELVAASLYASGEGAR